MEPNEYAETIQQIVQAGKALCDCEKRLMMAAKEAADRGAADQTFVLVRTLSYVAICTSAIRDIAVPFDAAIRDIAVPFDAATDAAKKKQAEEND